jgi:glycosyltransferase involved in cell wall biosynthesis
LLPRKICFLVGTLSQGGAERQLYYMVRALHEQGHALTVLCLTQGEFWESRIKDLGVPVRWVGQSANRPARLLKIVREVRRLKPDILQSSHFFTNLPAAMAGTVLRIPAIGAVRTDCLNEVAGPGKVFGLLNLRAPKCIAGNSKAGLRNAQMLGVPQRRLFFLPNVVDSTAFRVLVKTPHNPIRVVTAGRLVDQKRHDRFLRLVSQLQSNGRFCVKGIIVGNGPKRGALIRQSQELDLTDRIEFRGLVQDMSAVYDEADIFVLTSDWEGTPNVVLEAMASGVPVVSTDVGDVKELIEDGVSGFLVGADAEDQLVRRVRCLIEDSALRHTIADSARRRVEAKFSVLRLSEYLDCLYRAVES